MKFSEAKFKNVDFYLRDVFASVESKEHYIGSWAREVYKEFCGKRSGDIDAEPQPTATPEVACNEFVEYLAQRYFPTDGSWINIKEKTQENLDILEVLRKRVGESNFYSQMAGFLKNGVLFNTALITCDYGGNELHFINYDVINSNIRVIDKDIIKRGFLKRERHATAINSEYKTDDLGIASEGFIDTHLLYLPIIDRYITGVKPEEGENFFSIEIYMDKILVRKDDTIPAFSTFPIHPFRPTNVRSMGHEALGEALELKEMVFQLRKRVKYVNNPSVRLPEKFFNTLRNVLKTKPEDIIHKGTAIPIPPGSDKADIGAVKLENEFPIDMQYIQMLEHKIFHVFKAELISRAKVVGLTTAEDAQRQLGIHNELAPLIGHVVETTAKNLINRAVVLLQNSDDEFKKVAGKRKINIFTDFYLHSTKKYTKINSMMRLLEAVGAVGSINPADAQVFQGDVFLEKLAKELELPDVLGQPEDVDKTRMAMSQAATQPMVDESQAEKNQADAELKQAQAAQVQQGL